MGARGEREAARYLKRCGYRILLRNFRCKAGEIDLIVADGENIAFVEVKTRSNDDPGGGPSVGVSPDQQYRIGRAARQFLERGGGLDRPFRFDIVAIVWPIGGRPRIEHYKAAFHPRGL